MSGTRSTGELLKAQNPPGRAQKSPGLGDTERCFTGELDGEYFFMLIFHRGEDASQCSTRENWFRVTFYRGMFSDMNFTGDDELWHYFHRGRSSEHTGVDFTGPLRQGVQVMLSFLK